MNMILLSNHAALTTDDPKVMLKAQYEILMELSQKYPRDQVIQSFMADANLLNLEARQSRQASSTPHADIDWQHRAQVAEEALALAIGPTCTGCVQPIDPEWCHCGEAVEAHWQGSGHSPVAMGCTCYQDDPEQHKRAAIAHRIALFQARAEIERLRVELLLLQSGRRQSA